MTLRSGSSMIEPLDGLDVQTRAAHRQFFLRACLGVLVLSSLLFYGLHQPNYDHWVHGVAAALYVLLLAGLQLGVPYALVTHLSFLLSIVHLAVVIAQTGGINSVVMVWMTLVALPATLLLNRAGAIFWGAVVLLVHVLIWLLTQNQVLDSLSDMDDGLIVWTFMNKALVVCMAMAVVWLAERMHNQQVTEIDKSNRALEETHHALRQAQAHKDEFIASVGHELRAPMNAILGLNGVLRAELSAQPEDAEVVDHIRRSTEQLLQVVNDILDFSQLQAGRMTVRQDRFELGETLQAVRHLFVDKAAAKGLALQLDDHGVRSMWVQGDRLRLNQVLKNLLDNAIKFTNQGGIWIRAQSVGLGVRFEIEDTGIGIAADRLQQIFNRFEHADLQTNRQFGGAGLGLSICERLVTLQGGHIGVSSVLGQGSTFWFDLPLSMTAAGGNAPAPQIDHLIGRPLRILLVDDNAVNLMVARLMLKKFLPQARIIEAHGAAAALDLLHEQTVDLVLMDMVMPDMDGLQATQILRAHFPPPVCDVPVLGLTASTHPLDRERCLAAGMNDVLHKPLDEAQLMAQLLRMPWPPATEEGA